MEIRESSGGKIMMMWCGRVITYLGAGFTHLQGWIGPSVFIPRYRANRPTDRPQELVFGTISPQLSTTSSSRIVSNLGIGMFRRSEVIGRSALQQGIIPQAFEPRNGINFCASISYCEGKCVHVSRYIVLVG